jgi:hypothetical protein
VSSRSFSSSILDGITTVILDLGRSKRGENLRISLRKNKILMWLILAGIRTVEGLRKIHKIHKRI